MADNQEVNKKSMNEEERLALCQKLDAELDEFINSLEKKRYTEGWQEDRWQLCINTDIHQDEKEEMEKHPFFMKNAPQNGELSPLAEGLAKLKYDPDENTPLELATSYKEDGNFNFKHKNYRLAIISYTEGIKVNCGDLELEASLYNNRAAAHWHLKNYRSSLIDSEKALTFNPHHKKAQLRAAKSAVQIAKYDICIEHCTNYLKTNSSDKDVIELLNIAKKKKQIQDRDQRKKNNIDHKKEQNKQMIIKAIIDRKIKISKCDDGDDIDLSNLEPSLPGAADAIVHLENGILKWPILFLYPEYQMTDFVRDCPENVSLLCQLEQLFPAPWDEENKYRCETINVYFEGYDKMPHIIDPNKELGSLVVQRYFELKAGTPAFFVLPRGTAIERRFLENYV